MASLTSLSISAEERQDRTDKRRRIDAENRQGGTHMQNGHDYVPVKPTPARPALPPASYALPNDSTLPPGPSSLPARPAWVVPPVEEAKPDIAAMVGSNSSIVANRKAIRMANLSAAEMIKAELAGGAVADSTAVKRNLSAAELLKKELAGESVEEDTTMAEPEKIVEIVEEAMEAVPEPAVAAVEVDETMGIDGEPRGHKRKADEVEEEKVEEDEDEDEEAVDAFLAASLLPAVVVPGIQVPAPLKLMGNNVVEQEDTVQ